MREKKRKVLTRLPRHFEIEEEGFVVEAEPQPLEVGSAYSFSLRYNDQGVPQVHVKTYGDVNLPELRQMIKKMYPNARLRLLETTPTVELVKPTRPTRKKRKKPTKRKKKRRKSRKK